MRPVLMALCLVACHRNPATGAKTFNLLSTPQSIALGNEAQPKFLASYGGEVPDAEVVGYVRTLGKALAAQSEVPNLPWEFHVVDSEVVNAFALPGGKIFVSRGLLEHLDNEAQLAGVLGHEIGHVTAEHIGQQMSRAMAITLGTTALGVFAQQQDDDWLRALGVGAQVGGALYLLRFSRTQETQADALGMRYMERLGYNPAGQAQVLAILAKLSAGSGRPPEFLLTHPDPEDRVDDAVTLLNTDFADTEATALAPKRYERDVLEPLAKLPPPEHKETDEERAAVEGSRRTP
jgi:predicted Zn-dependent protease